MDKYAYIAQLSTTSQQPSPTPVSKIFDTILISILDPAHSSSWTRTVANCENLTVGCCSFNIVIIVWAFLQLFFEIIFKSYLSVFFSELQTRKFETNMQHC